MSPCCHHARSRYVVNYGGRKLCREGKRYSRNASDNSRRVMTSWWHGDTWHGGIHDCVGKGDGGKWGKCTSGAVGQSLTSCFTTVRAEAALKQSRAAQACSSKHVQKGPRVEWFMMILVWCLMIQRFIYTQTLEIWTRGTHNVLVWRGEFSFPRDESNTWWQFVEINPVEQDSSNPRYYPCRWTEFVKSVWVMLLILGPGHMALKNVIKFHYSKVIQRWWIVHCHLHFLEDNIKLKLEGFSNV